MNLSKYHKSVVYLILPLCFIFAFSPISFAGSEEPVFNAMKGAEIERDWAVLMKTADGKYYEVPVKTNEGYYGEVNQCFYEIDELKYLDAKQDSMMSLARADGKPFKYTATFKRHVDENAVSIEKEVLEIDFQFYEAYETSFNSSSLKSKIPDRENIDWKMVLNKDLIVEEPYYLKSLNHSSRDQTLSINYNMIIDGQGHKIYRTSGDSGYIVIVARAIDDKTEQNKPTVVFKNLTIDGRVNGNGKSNFRGILLLDKAYVILSEGTTIQNCRTHKGSAGGAGVNVGPSHSSSGSTILEIQKGASIKQCVSIHGGGGIDLGNGTRLIMNGGEISNCHSEKGGGAISAFSDCEINIEEVTFSGNSTKEYGGAIESFMNNNDIKIGNVLFTNNQAKKGGAIYVEDCALNIKESSFSNNDADDSGGAVYSRGTDLTINDSNFRKNNARYRGGAVDISFNKGKTTVIKSSELIENTAGLTGGGIHVSAKQIDLTGCFLRMNSARTGGGMYLSKSDMSKPATIHDTIFENNFANDGAGAYLEDKTDLKKVIFRNNGNTLSQNLSPVTTHGGGLHINWGAEVNISENSIFENNFAIFGGAISLYDGKLKIEDSVVEKNTACESKTMNGGEGLGGGIYVGRQYDGYNELTVINSRIRENNGIQGAGVHMCRGFAIFKDVDFNNNHTIPNRKSHGEGGGLFLEWGANADLVGETKFKENKARWGGAIYTSKNSTRDPINVRVPLTKKDPYQNLRIEKSVIFSGNEATSGLYNPPSNYSLFTNLKYDEKNSDVPHGLSRTSLLNNYDVYYKTEDKIISYDPNGGAFSDNTMEIKTENHHAGETIKLMAAPTRAGYVFAGWKEADVLYEAGADYLVKKDHTFVAQWKQEVRIDFNLNYTNKDGTTPEGPKPIVIEKGATLGDRFPKDPVREGYKFKGWNTKADGKGSIFNKDTKVTDNVTLYAQWEKVVSPTPNPGTDSKTPGVAWGSVQVSVPALNTDDHYAYLFGYPNRTFMPEKDMTRAEAAAMFARLLKEYPSVDHAFTEDFTDVRPDAWYYKEVAYMSELGILSGYPDKTYKPDAPITRAEFAVMAARFDKLSAGHRSFNDLQSDHWAYSYIMSAATKGWITGYPDGSFKPEKHINRAEVVSLANRMLNRFADKSFVDKKPAGLTTYSDLTKEHWAYYEVMEATNGHDFTRSGEKSEHWTNLNYKRLDFNKR